MSRCHPHALMTFSGLATSKSRPVGQSGFSVAALPTDPVGSSTLTLASETDLTGAEIRIYDLDNLPAGSLGTELAGVESCTGPTFDYFYSYGVTPNLVWIQVMAPGFEEYGQRFTLPTRDTTLSLILTPELNT